MGRVFTWTEIKDGQTPKLHDFDYLHRLIRRAFEQKEWFIGGVVFGSSWENPSMRSDIDVLAVYKSDMRHEFIETATDLMKEAKALHVPLQIVPLDDKVIDTPVHGIRPFLYRHILLCAKTPERIIKGVPYIRMDDSLEAQKYALRSYVAYRIRDLQESMVNTASSEVERCQRLQKILDTPVHVARMVLQYMNISFSNDDRISVIKLFAEARPDMKRLFQKLVEVDQKYYIILQDQLHQPSRHTYEEFLRTVEREAAPQTYRFLLNIGKSL